MGSWDVSCGVTNFPIGCGDRCVCIYLKKPKHLDEFSGWDATSTFIRGVYDDYGRIDPDVNQKYWGADQEKIESGDGVMWIKEDIFDSLRLMVADEYDEPKIDSVYYNSKPNKSALKSLGFKFAKDISEETEGYCRYNQRWEHSSSPDYWVVTDGEYSKITFYNESKKTVEYVEALYKVDRFVEKWEELTGEKLDVSEVKKQRYQAVKVVQTLGKSLPANKKNSDLIEDQVAIEQEDTLKKLLRMSSLPLLGMTSDMLDSVESDENFKMEEFSESWADVMNIKWFTQACNIKFSPTYRGGSQCGAVKANDFLLKATNEMREKEIKNNPYDDED